MKVTGMSLVLAAGALGLGLGLAAISVSASASEKEGTERACAVQANPDGSKPAALSDAELRSRLEAAGYKEVRSLGHEDGCVEAKGMKDGKRFEVYLHPTTGEIISQR